MKRFVILLTLLFATVAHGQNATDIFGFQFKQTTTDDATAKLGRPKQELVDQLPTEVRFTGPEKLDDRMKVLIYEPLAEWKKAHLWFLDSKLIAMEFWPKNKTERANELPSKFTTDFLLVANFSKGVDLASFEGQKETTVPKVYPTRYYMLAVRKDCFIIALINNDSVKAIFKQGASRPTTQMFPGYIENVMIFGRKSSGN